MKSNVKVITVKSAPNTLRNPDIQMGIRDAAAAAEWARKRGYQTVYFIGKKQKVYAEKLQVRVDEQAEALEAQSVSLLETAEAAL